MPAIALSTASGVRGVPAERINAALTLGATKLQVLRHVILPNALPEILVGARIGLSVGWSTLVAAELVAATRGLGFMIQSASNFLVTDVVIVGILTIAAIAFTMEFAMRILERKLTPWKGSSRTGDRHDHPQHSFRAPSAHAGDRRRVEGLDLAEPLSAEVAEALADALQTGWCSSSPTSS